MGAKVNQLFLLKNHLQPARAPERAETESEFEPLFAAFAASKISFLGTMQYIHAQDISFDKWFAESEPNHLSKEISWACMYCIVPRKLIFDAANAANNGSPLPLNTILPLDSLRGLSFELHTSWTTIMLENWYILGQFEPLFAAFAQPAKTVKGQYGVER
jgi:hypothetical protein